MLRPTAAGRTDMGRARALTGCGLAVIGADIDVLDPEAALEVEALARKMLGDTPALRVGRNPKRTLVYSDFAGRVGSASARSRSCAVVALPRWDDFYRPVRE